MENSQEESSWTFYIEGFNNNDNNNNNNVDDQQISTSYFSEYEESPSLLSDAASSAVKKGLGFSNYSGKSIRNICKQNSFKKQKTKVVCSMVDLELEDTASSPVNSPKMSYMNQFMNQKEKGKLDVSEVKRNIFGKGKLVFTGDRKGGY
ncbi:hypothetical protein ACJIZ3_013118 [Penstemon smallii]|uniref:Uncharacterized protein n=1 Tax=Penstemon smallii TaxID=265156 RepID=A0ABD3UR25_9LAMI